MLMMCGLSLHWRQRELPAASHIGRAPRAAEGRAPRLNPHATPAACTPQGSPTTAERRNETYRHALAATTVRPGMDGTPYLYTLNLSCPEVRLGGGEEGRGVAHPLAHAERVVARARRACARSRRHALTQTHATPARARPARSPCGRTCSLSSRRPSHRSASRRRRATTSPRTRTRGASSEAGRDFYERRGGGRRASGGSAFAACGPVATRGVRGAPSCMLRGASDPRLTSLCSSGVRARGFAPCLPTMHGFTRLAWVGCGGAGAGCGGCTVSHTQAGQGVAGAAGNWQCSCDSSRSGSKNAHPADGLERQGAG